MLIHNFCLSREEPNGDEPNEIMTIQENDINCETTITTGKATKTKTENGVETNKSNAANINRRTKLFKNRRVNPPRRYESTAPLVHKIYTQEYAFHRGFFLKIGDIVALRGICNDTNTMRKNDSDDGLAAAANIYFAQIRAFMCDQYGQKSAVITWLIPAMTTSTTAAATTTITDFDLDSFVLGPAEEIPRPLDSLEFVCRPDQLASTGLTNRTVSQQRYGSVRTNADTAAVVVEDRFDYLNQYKCDMLRHKFDLEELAAANFRIITSKIVGNAAADSTSTNSSAYCRVKHEFIMSN